MEKRKMKKKTLIIIAAIVIVVAVLILTHLPKDIEQTMTFTAADGTTAEVVFDLRYYPNLILPCYVKGTVTIDGVEYTDMYTMLDRLPGQSENRLFGDQWWKNRNTVYNMSFLKTDYTDIWDSLNNRIDLAAKYDGNRDSICTAYYVDFFAEKYYWGPAQNYEEAKKIAESFGYKEP